MNVRGGTHMRSRSIIGEEKRNIAENLETTEEGRENQSDEAGRWADRAKVKQSSHRAAGSLSGTEPPQTCGSRTVAGIIGISPVCDGLHLLLQI